MTANNVNPRLAWMRWPLGRRGADASHQDAPSELPVLVDMGDLEGESPDPRAAASSRKHWSGERSSSSPCVMMRFSSGRTGRRHGQRSHPARAAANVAECAEVDGLRYALIEEIVRGRNGPAGMSACTSPRPAGRGAPATSSQSTPVSVRP